jgi:ABC-2 type transport system permease protein
MNKIGLIIQREYLTRVKKKSFILMTLLGPLFMVGIFGLIIYLSIADEGKQNILVVDEMAPIFDNLEAGSNYQFSYTDLSLQEAQDLFKDSDYTSILYIPENIDASNRAILYFKSQPSMRIINSVERKVERVVENMKLMKYKIDPEHYRKVRTDFSITSFKFNESGEAEQVMNEKAIVGFVFSFLTFFFILYFGTQVMKGVMEEKSNRIVEVLITSVKPFQLMMGKIVGIALVGLTQFVIWVALISTLTSVGQSMLLDQKQQEATMEMAMEQLPQDGQVRIQESNPFDITDPNNLINRVDWPLMFGMFIFYFLGGYLLYASLYAAIGSAVDSESDAQQFMMPVMAPLMGAYFMASMIIENPSSPAGLWGSIIPFTSPILIMVKVAIGFDSGEYWILPVSMILLIATFIGLTWLAGKIYRVGILMHGKKVSYADLWKWIKYTN